MSLNRLLSQGARSARNLESARWQRQVRMHAKHARGKNRGVALAAVAILDIANHCQRRRCLALLQKSLDELAQALREL